MKNKHQIIDGFIPRRSGEKLGDLHHDKSIQSLGESTANIILDATGASSTDNRLGEQQFGRGLGRSDIDESLNDIDEETKNEADKKLSRKQKKLLTNRLKRPKSLFRRILKWSIILVIIASLSAGGYTLYKFIGASGSVLQGNILDIFKNQPLKEDLNGRSNFLVLGTSEDDPGHPASLLTDSMLVVSIDQDNKNVYMFSVPRDLYVKYGMACISGYSGKINEYFMCSNDGKSEADEQDRLSKVQDFVGDIFGIDIQYGVHINHTVIKEAVDAVGGVDVDIQGSNGASGILDRNFDWRCNYTCYLVKYDNGVHHLDGEHALFLSMARGDVAPTYGLGNSNFDREKNQQKIVIALRDKALTTGTLTNLSAITQMIDALGNNLRTNIDAAEISTLMQIAGNIKADGIKSLSLVDDGLLSTGNYGGASVVIPSAGVYNYGDIRNYLENNLSSNPIVKESASIVVLNGTTVAGLGQKEADKLSLEKYNILTVGNAPTNKYKATEIYQINKDKTETVNKLSEMYGVSIKTTKPSISIDSRADILIIIGQP